MKALELRNGWYTVDLDRDNRVTYQDLLKLTDGNEDLAKQYWSKYSGGNQDTDGEAITLEQFFAIRNAEDRARDYLFDAWPETYDRVGDGEVTLEDMNNDVTKDHLNIKTDE
jgi:Ca2+-binding EF-hand superfamily protein